MTKTNNRRWTIPTYAICKYINHMIIVVGADTAESIDVIRHDKIHIFVIGQWGRKKQKFLYPALWLFVNFRCICFSERLSNHVWTNMKNPYFYERKPGIESCPIMKRGRQLPSQKSKSINVVHKWKFSKLTVAKCWPMQFLGPIENWMLQYVGRVLKWKKDCKW